WFHTHQNRQYYSGHIWEALPSKVEANTDIILALLDELELKATFFVLGWVAAHNPDVVKKIHAKGHEIGAHSHWHHNPQLLKPDDFEKDIQLCLSHIQDLTGEKVTAYRAPGFNLKLKDNWAFEILAKNGIKVDSSVQINRMKNNPPVVIKAGDSEILEFPLITSSIGIPYSGGGYFRVLPKFYINHFIRKHDYNLLYLHPRDFDDHYPFSNLFSLFRNLLNSINTSICRDHLIDVLSELETCTIKEAAIKYKSTNKV
ncbi:MAG: hypothetical protein DRJ09_07670, partial [Bacteroidetes bacterium]